MFERFTDRARRVVALSHDEARAIHHIYTGTEHLLLGILGEGENIAAQALTSAGVTLEGARDKVEEIVGRGMQEMAGYIPFTPRAKKTFEQALACALQFNHAYIAPEHLMLGMFCQAEDSLRRYMAIDAHISGVAIQVIARLGVDFNQLRNDLLARMQPEYLQTPRPEVLVVTPQITTEFAVTLKVPKDVHARLTEELVGLDIADPEYHLRSARFCEREATRRRKLAARLSQTAE